MRGKLWIVLFIALASAPSAWARDTFYIAPSQVSLEVILGPPPAADSEAQKEDLRTVLDAQKKRTQADVAQAKTDADISVFSFSDILGPQFAPERLPYAKAFFERVLNDENEAIAAAKAHFDRPRPPTVSKAVKPALDAPTSASYPSGHATFAYVHAILLADMVPEKSREIFERAARYARSRVIAGVHFPSDIAAGRLSASVIDNTLLHEPRFLLDFDRAKSEVRAALGLQ
jgi:acid phosphatase (class A)